MATTPGAIRDRMSVLVTGITPTVHAGQKFLAHRHQEPLRDWAEANPTSCLRRFTVRSEGDTSQAAVTDHVVERVEETILVEVAYPTDWRHGGTQLLGLDDVINADAVRIEAAIGVASSDSALKLLATIFRPGDVAREPTGPVTYLTIRYRVEYARSLA